MVKGFRRTLAMLLVLLLCCSAAATAESAQKVVKLFPQHRYWLGEEDCSFLCHMPLKQTEKYSTMCTSGCMIYAFVHAMEWCRQEKLTNMECKALIQEFMAADPAPWDVLYVVDERYHNVVRAHDLEVLPEPPTDPKDLIRFFRQNGAVICNMGGHCTAAIGYTYHDWDEDGEEDLMIHLLDSALWSSAKKQYIFDFETFKWLNVTWECAGECWLPYEAYVTMDRLAIRPIQPENKK